MTTIAISPLASVKEDELKKIILEYIGDFKQHGVVSVALETGSGGISIGYVSFTDEKSCQRGYSKIHRKYIDGEKQNYEIIEDTLFSGIGLPVISESSLEKDDNTGAQSKGSSRSSRSSNPDSDRKSSRHSSRRHHKHHRHHRSRHRHHSSSESSSDSPSSYSESSDSSSDEKPSLDSQPDQDQQQRSSKHRHHRRHSHSSSNRDSKRSRR